MSRHNGYFTLGRISRWIKNDIEKWYDPDAELPGYQIWPEGRSMSVKVDVHPFQENHLVPIDQKFLRNFAKLLEATAKHFQGDVQIYGTISKRGHSQPAISFRVIEVPLATGISTKKRQITLEDLDDMHRVKARIIRRTTESDLLLFLGNSPAYFYYAFGDQASPAAKSPRNIHLLPFSNRPTREEFTYYDEAFDRYVTGILEPALNKKPYERIVIVDVSYTGQTVDSFASMLRLSGLIDHQTIFLLNIVPRCDQFQLGQGTQLLARINFGADNSENCPNGFNPADFNDYTDGRIGRVVAPYPIQYWDTPPDQVTYPDMMSAGWLRDSIRQNTLEPKTTTRARWRPTSFRGAG
ncbi:MAG: hypothetical protein M1825_003425 [Sarcosagium campestre]|nr:MAG: hypothetical protein M1825_003425 [Sarcosagium campestre]